jgi:hypothetical protein
MFKQLKAEDKAKADGPAGEVEELTKCTHGNEATHICDCKGALLCDAKCLKQHMGPGHKKTPLIEVSKSFATIVTGKINNSADFYREYKVTETGEFFDSYIDFYDTCKLSAHNLRQHYDKEDPWKK